MSITIRRLGSAAGLAALAALAAQPAAAQIRTVDPSSAQARSDIAPAGSGQPETSGPPNAPTSEAYNNASPPAENYRAAPPETNVSRAPDSQTYREGDVLDAAEGVFGRGAEGLAKIVEKILKDQGRPTAYISGREASGAFAVGLRYGSGVLHHKIEGDRPVFWTGPSLGFDVGGNASKEFILVYNLYDSQDVYKRFPAAEGTAYFIGGFTAS